MPRYAIIDEHGIVQNVIEWDGVKGWVPPEGCRVVPGDTANIGDKVTGLAPVDVPVPTVRASDELSGVRRTITRVPKV